MLENRNAAAKAVRLFPSTKGGCPLCARGWKDHYPFETTVIWLSVKWGGALSGKEFLERLPKALAALNAAKQAQQQKERDYLLQLQGWRLSLPSMATQ